MTRGAPFAKYGQFQFRTAAKRRRGNSGHQLSLMRLRALRRLSSQEWGLLLIAAVTVSAVRVALWVLSSRRILRMLQRRATTPLDALPRSSVSTSAVAWAVEQASRVVPQATCLTQALAAAWLLRRFGHPSRLCLGVTRGETGDFRAHAWLEWEGRVIIGGMGRRSLTPLPDLTLPQGIRTGAGR